jgi:hypothetical protein
MPEMSIFYSHRERFRDPTGERRSPAASLSEMAARRLRKLARRAVGRAAAAFGFIHRGIVTAKTRRLQRELRFYAGSGDGWPLSPGVREIDDPDANGERIPQRPLVLEDKWDF